MADLSSSKFYLVYYVIYQKMKAVELDVFSPVNSCYVTNKEALAMLFSVIKDAGSGG